MLGFGLRVLRFGYLKSWDDLGCPSLRTVYVRSSPQKPHIYYKICLFLFVGYCYKPIMELTEPGNDTKSRLREVTVVKLLDTEASSFR